MVVLTRFEHRGIGENGLNKAGFKARRTAADPVLRTVATFELASSSRISRQGTNDLVAVIEFWCHERREFSSDHGNVKLAWFTKSVS